MTRIAVISPHCDDALFAVGEHMLSRPNDSFTIISPLEGWPPPGEKYDKAVKLKNEHHAVLQRCGWSSVSGPFLDDGVHGRVDFTVEDMQSFLEWALEDGVDRPIEVWAPFGIRHPDHRAIAEACRNIADSGWWWYEELPYRVDSPEEASIRHHRLVDLFGISERVGFGPSVGEPNELLAAKRRLCNLYASQIGPDIERHLYADERLWR